MKISCMCTFKEIYSARHPADLLVTSHSYCLCKSYQFEEVYLPPLLVEQESQAGQLLTLRRSPDSTFSHE
jgi:hypothetical protein